MAEWLKRWARNPMGIPHAGSNPAHSANFLKHLSMNCRVSGSTPGSSRSHVEVSLNTNIYIHLSGVTL